MITRRLFLKGAVAAIGAVSSVRALGGTGTAAAVPEWIGVDLGEPGSERTLMYGGGRQSGKSQLNSLQHIAEQREQALIRAMRLIKEERAARVFNNAYLTDRDTWYFKQKSTTFEVVAAEPVHAFDMVAGAQPKAVGIKPADIAKDPIIGMALNSAKPGELVTVQFNHAPQSFTERKAVFSGDWGKVEPRDPYREIVIRVWDEAHAIDKALS